jgi:hypothetical protein
MMAGMRQESSIGHSRTHARIDAVAELVMTASIFSRLWRKPPQQGSSPMKKQISYARHLLNLESVSILMVVGIALSVLWISDIDFTGWEAQEDPVINQEDEDFEELPTASDKPSQSPHIYFMMTLKTSQLSPWRMKTSGTSGQPDQSF